ncbi:GNAT family N-acetyltransferase [Brevundimonas subvibrioides]|uniref:Acetyltransferase-like protein n=1 Tax=Brevundimonas subvibrioides (strain ATCC 15264 / DSM 4735 / LMG 14903 / NBRC 16000 / CB 81) TaxID=633149 RepID=D9QN41_BRESC|nr:GNAT family N-acetyltransferase [Brevundimonas subvibrioides]ADL00242.1 acetyltransferase-like protein [Brevundimonas subvibrioides ATCC 15264]
MSDFQDLAADQRYEQTFEDGTTTGRVWADYADSSGGRAILHVEAEDALRGSGAAGKFMQSLADHARENGTRLIPRCSYAVAWFKRHPDQADVLA